MGARGTSGRRRGRAGAGLLGVVLLAACGSGTGDSAGGGRDGGGRCRAPAEPAASPAPVAREVPPPGFDLALRLPSATQFMAAGFGSIWVPSPDEGTVTRVDPRSGEVQGVVDLSAEAPADGPPVPAVQAVAVTPSGVWVTSPRGAPLVCLDPTTLAVAERVEVGSTYAAAADGEDLWVTDFEGGRVLRVDTAAGRVTTTVEDVLSPGGVAVGDGAVWVAAHRAGTLVRLDAGTGARTGSVELGGILEQVVHADGSAWVAGNATRAVHEVSADLQRRDTALPSNGYGLAVTDEAVWAATGDQVDCEDDGALVRIDRRSGERRSLPLPCVFGVVAVDGEVWATSEAPGLLVRVADP